MIADDNENATPLPVAESGAPIAPTPPTADAPDLALIPLTQAPSANAPAPSVVGEFQIAWKSAGAPGRIHVSITMTDGTSSTHRLVITDAAAREKLAGELCEKYPGLDFDEIGAELEAMAREQVVSKQAPGDSGSQRQNLINIALGKDVELFHGDNGTDDEPYATIDEAGVHRTHAVKSKAFKSWLLSRYYHLFGDTPSAQAVQEALALIVAIAHNDRPKRRVDLRCAAHEGEIYIDLGDESWSAVRITKTGWQLVPSGAVPVRFVRAKGGMALPVPVKGGRIDDLRKHVNVPSDDEFLLLCAGLIAYLRPAGPYPVLAVNGEQGSAKSWLCRVVRRLIDPNMAPLRRPPKEERDLAVAAQNARMIAMDNLSGLPQQMSDAICSLATGGGFGTRELYTDGEEKIFSAMRPVVLNGIEDVAVRADLLDRSIVLSLPEIPEDRRRDEARLLAEFEADAPKILGALLDAVVVALARLDDTHLPGSPRMADFARWATAAEPALPCAAGGFMRAYASNRADAVVSAIEASLVGSLVTELMADRTIWQSTMTELHTEIRRRAAEAGWPARDTPKSARALANQLKRVAPNLRASGITVRQGERSNDRQRTRRVTIERRDPEVADGSGRYELAYRPQENGPGEAGRAIADGTDGADGPSETLGFGDKADPLDTDHAGAAQTLREGEVSSASSAPSAIGLWGVEKADSCGRYADGTASIADGSRPHGPPGGPLNYGPADPCATADPACTGPDACRWPQICFEANGLAVEAPSALHEVALRPPAALVPADSHSSGHRRLGSGLNKRARRSEDDHG